MKKSELERKFETLWLQLGGPPLKPEYRFHPERRWRFDLASPIAKVAIELEGGVWSGGRHTRGIGFSGDCEKYNTAQLMGWRVFRFTTDMLNDPDKHLLPVRDLIRAMTEHERSSGE